jgi:hypothetical protein
MFLGHMVRRLLKWSWDKVTLSAYILSWVWRSHMSIQATCINSSLKCTCNNHHYVAEVVNDFLFSFFLSICTFSYSMVCLSIKFYRVASFWQRECVLWARENWPTHIGKFPQFSTMKLLNVNFNPIRTLLEYVGSLFSILLNVWVH